MSWMKFVRPRGVAIAVDDMAKAAGGL